MAWAAGGAKRAYGVRRSKLVGWEGLGGDGDGDF